MVDRIRSGELALLEAHLDAVEPLLQLIDPEEHVLSGRRRADLFGVHQEQLGELLCAREREGEPRRALLTCVQTRLRYELAAECRGLLGDAPGERALRYDVLAHVAPRQLSLVVGDAAHVAHGLGELGLQLVGRRLQDLDPVGVEPAVSEDAALLGGLGSRARLGDGAVHDVVRVGGARVAYGSLEPVVGCVFEHTVDYDTRRLHDRRGRFRRWLGRGLARSLHAFSTPADRFLRRLRRGLRRRRLERFPAALARHPLGNDLVFDFPPGL